MFDRALRLVDFRHRYWARYDGVRVPKRHYPNILHKLGRSIAERDHDGFPVLEIHPKSQSMTGHIVALHGGGYVAEASSAHISAYCRLADLTKMTVVAPLYPLAPFHSPGRIREWTLSFLATLDGPLRLTGDSAGGNLALQVIASGVEVDRMVLWSPWLDVGASNPQILARDGACALLPAKGMREFGAMYYGTSDPTDPMLSPLFRETEKLPPTLVISGDRDLLHPDIEAWTAKRAEQGAPVELHTEAGVWHDYMLLPTPEAKRALDMTAKFMIA